jgi:hypothetical protein
LSFSDLRAEFAMKGDGVTTATAVTLGDLNARAHGDGVCSQHATLVARRALPLPTAATSGAHLHLNDDDDEDDNGGGGGERLPLVQVLVQTLGGAQAAEFQCDVVVRVRLEALAAVFPNPHHAPWLHLVLAGGVGVLAADEAARVAGSP